MSGVCEVWTDFTCGVVLCGVSTVVLSKRGGGAGCQKEVGRPAPLRYLCMALKTVHVDDIDKRCFLIWGNCCYCHQSAGYGQSCS